jgi:hypothetical protein
MEMLKFITSSDRKLAYLPAVTIKDPSYKYTRDITDHG